MKRENVCNGWLYLSHSYGCIDGWVEGLGEPVNSPNITLALGDDEGERDASSIATAGVSPGGVAAQATMQETNNQRGWSTW